MSRIIRIEVSDTLYDRMMRKKSKDGFKEGGSSGWRRWFSTLCGDILLFPTLEKQCASAEGLLPMWMRSFSANLHDIWVGHELRELVGEAEGKRTVVVGRGPSLFRLKHIEMLKQHRAELIIVATDGAYIDLLKGGVTPNYVCSVDGSDVCAKWYDSPLIQPTARDTKAVICSQTSRKVVELIKKQGLETYWFHPATDMITMPNSLTRALLSMTVSEKHPNGLVAQYCHPKDTSIYTINGPKPIQDLKVGDLVYSFEEPHLFKSQVIRTVTRLHEKQCFKPVTAIYDRGVKEVYRITTKTRTVKATLEHQFLTYQDGIFTWKPLQNIKIGDIIMIVKRLPSTDNSLISDLDLMRFLGCFTGDGNIRRVGKKGGEVNLSLYDDALIAKYTQIIKQVFNISPHNTKKGVLSIYSGAVVTYLEELGFLHKSLSRRVPSWIFNLKDDAIKAFLEGYVDADASIEMMMTNWGKSAVKSSNSRIRFESPNKELIEDMRYLYIRLGYRVGLLLTRTRKNIRIWNGSRWYEYPSKTFYGFNAFPDSPRAKYLSWRSKQSPYWLQNTKYLALEEVKMIRQVGEEEVYDISVEDTHNFIAEGIISHNCGGNIGTTSLVIAMNILKSTDIALIGFDFSYPKDLPLSESYYYDRSVEFEGYLNTNIKYDEYHHPIFNTWALIDPVFKSYRDSLYETLQVLTESISITNCTGGGVLNHRNMPCKTFQEWLSNEEK